MNTKKNVERINKEKTVDYEKKMAALNAEINLTQNLYNSFISAKSKAVRKPSDGPGIWAYFKKTLCIIDLIVPYFFIFFSTF